MDELYPFFLIIFASVFFSMVFRRIHMPWVVALIVGGILIGPHVLGFLTITPTGEFIGQIGLVFLMFMAGLETHVDKFRNFQKKILWVSFLNGAVPFVAGFGIAILFGYEMLSALLVGIIFISSSIAVVVPSLERNGLMNTYLGHSAVITSIIQDIGSLILLSIVLQTVSPVTRIPLFVFYPLLVGVIVLLMYLIPKISRLFTRNIRGGKDIFQQGFRALFVIMIGTVIIFELLGLHPIIAGFFAGLVLAKGTEESILREKIRTIAYGVFIPVFFVVIGAQTNVKILLDFGGAALIVVAIVLGSIASKFTSGWIGGKIMGFGRNESSLFAASSVPQLSTTLAVAFSALSLGIIDDKLVTAMIILSVVTVMISPTLMNFFGNRLKGRQI